MLHRLRGMDAPDRKSNYKDYLGFENESLDTIAPLESGGIKYNFDFNNDDVDVSIWLT